MSGTQLWLSEPIPNDDIAVTRLELATLWLRVLHPNHCAIKGLFRERYDQCYSIGGRTILPRTFEPITPGITDESIDEASVQVGEYWTYLRCKRDKPTFIWYNLDIKNMYMARSHDLGLFPLGCHPWRPLETPKKRDFSSRPKTGMFWVSDPKWKIVELCVTISKAIGRTYLTNGRTIDIRPIG